MSGVDDQVHRALRIRPQRQAIVLLGGDKRGNWRGWYEQNIPKADDLYDDYLTYLEEQQP